jgi:hypothetical protein
VRVRRRSVRVHRSSVASAQSAVRQSRVYFSNGHLRDPTELAGDEKTDKNNERDGVCVLNISNKNKNSGKMPPTL